MTRCKKMLILIGDMRFLSSCQNEPVDDMNNSIYEGSEKQFSDFIQKILKDIQQGSGELIPYDQYKKRISGI